MNLRLILICFLSAFSLHAANQSPLGPLGAISSPLASRNMKIPPNAVWCDRVVYAPNDPPAQVLVASQIFSKAVAGSCLRLSILDSAGKERDAQEFVVTDGQTAFLVAGKMDVSRLPEGSYSISGQISLADSGKSVELVPTNFSVGGQLRPVSAFPPEGVPLIVPPVSAPGSTTAPISLGAPLPFGAVASNERLEVWEDGHPILTQARPLAFWGPGPNDSVRWMGVSFLARYQDGKPRNYLLKKAVAKPVTTPLFVVDSAEKVAVDTGAIRFALSKRHFCGPEQVSVKSGDRHVALTSAALAGAYVVDETGRRYEAAADPAPEVRIEERGPVRTAVSVRGWYVDPKDASARFCQFQIRVYAYAGLARIDGFARTIVTYDTQQHKLADVGISLPAVDQKAGEIQWLAGIDGQTVQGKLPAGGEAFFSQASPDAVWLNQIEGEPAGKRSDGWLAISGSGITATGYLRDVWEKYPKEISSTGGLLTFHAWPKHGRRIVSAEEEITRENIHRNLFAHQGPLLDLQLPESYFQQLRKWNETKAWDRENTSFIGYRSVADGVSMSIRFGVDYQLADTPVEAIAAQASVNQMAPSAATDPKWNAASEVIPFITAAGDPRWKTADGAIDAFATGMSNLAAAGHVYGMWIYGNTNNNWDTTLNAPFLHRIWQNSHYGHASFPWKFYFRSGDPRFLKLARAQTGNLMDVGIVHYLRPEENGVYAGKGPGGLYHAKGWLPWGVRLRGEFETDSDVGTLQHWTNPKVFLERYFAEVDLEALDVFNLWFDRLVGTYQYRARYGVGRELTQSISELTDIYQNLWDPRLVGYLRPMGDSALGTPFRSYHSQLGFAFFNRTWPIRYFAFARDPKVLERLEEALPGESFGPYGMASAALLLNQRKDLARAPRLLSVVRQAERGIYRNPQDPLDGFGAYSSAVDSRNLDEIPSVLAALSNLTPAEVEAAAAISSKGLDSVYPASAGRRSIKKGTEAALILALNPDGRAFNVRFESRMGIDMLPATARILAPDETVIKTIALHDKSADGKPRVLRYLGANAPVVEIPAGLAGVYRIEFYGHFPVYRAPLTDLPTEVAVLAQGSASAKGFLFAPQARELKLKFSAGVPQGAPRPANFRVRNLDNAESFETTLLVGSKRTSASFALSGGEEGIRAEVQAPNLRWEPIGQTLYFALRPEDFAPVLKAMGTQTAPVLLDNPTAPAATEDAPEGQD